MVKWVRGERKRLLQCTLGEMRPGVLFFFEHTTHWPREDKGNAHDGTFNFTQHRPACVLTCSHAHTHTHTSKAARDKTDTWIKGCGLLTPTANNYTLRKVNNCLQRLLQCRRQALLLCKYLLRTTGAILWHRHYIPPLLKQCTMARCREPFHLFGNGQGNRRACTCKESCVFGQTITIF